MTGPRTVTVPTIDHGDVTITCPSWCVGHQDDAPLYRVDITHVGPDESLALPTSRGPATHLITTLEQRPFTERPPGIGTFVNVFIDSDWYPTGPIGLDAMADALVEHAAELRARARRLSALCARGESQ
ncbi:DUF6907 domain-containing protein [Streptomyces sp. NPDC002004]